MTKLAPARFIHRETEVRVLAGERSKWVAGLSESHHELKGILLRLAITHHLKFLKPVKANPLLPLSFLQLPHPLLCKQLAYSYALQSQSGLLKRFRRLGPILHTILDFIQGNTAGKVFSSRRP